MVSSDITLSSASTTESTQKLAGQRARRTFLCLSRGAWLKLTVFSVLVALALIAFLKYDAHKFLAKVLEWSEEHKAPGFFIFVVVYIVATVLFVPGVILTLGGGFVFGIWLGILAVWLGATIGETLAFLLGRYLFRDWIARKTKKFQIWQAIEAAAVTDGWKIVALIRLAPVLPYNALNYAFGLTAIKLWHYTAASSIGVIPGIVLYVYLGSLAEDLMSIAEGKAGVEGATFIATAVVSGVAVVLTLVLTAYYARKAIRRKLEVDENGNSVQDVEMGGSDLEKQLTTRFSVVLDSSESDQADGDTGS